MKIFKEETASVFNKIKETNSNSVAGRATVLMTLSIIVTIFNFTIFLSIFGIALSLVFLVQSIIWMKDFYNIFQVRATIVCSIIGLITGLYGFIQIILMIYSGNLLELLKFSSDGEVLFQMMGPIFNI